MFCKNKSATDNDNEGESLMPLNESNDFARICHGNYISTKSWILDELINYDRDPPDVFVPTGREKRLRLPPLPTPLPPTTPFPVHSVGEMRQMTLRRDLCAGGLRII